MRSYFMSLSTSLTWLLLVSGAIASRAMAQVDTPYAATVIVNDAALRSGPGADYYAVDLLARGSNVEVHKNIEGWCAIRPPEGSFSWVPARHLRLGATGKVAEVIEPKAVAWIGSNLARPKQHMYQVKLERGETVAICGETRFERKKEQITETWYKIEPPAGEFRWIESRFLSKPKSLGTELVEKEVSTPNLVAGNIEDSKPNPHAGYSAQIPETSVVHSSTVQTPMSPVSHEEPIQEPARLPTHSARVAAPLARPANPRKTGFSEVTHGVQTPTKLDNSAARTPAAPLGAANQQVTFVAPSEGGDSDRPRTFDSSRTPTPQLGNANPAPNNVTPNPTEISGVSDFETELKSLESQLGIAVSMHPVDWNLNTLRIQAKQLVERGSTPYERGRASMLADRIGLYETHQKKSIELEMEQASKSKVARNDAAAAPPGAPWKPAESTAPATEEEQPERTTKEPDAKNPSWMDKVADVVGNGLKGSPTEATPTHFDAQGKLQKVIVKDESVKYPPYALLDNEGKVVAFIGSPVVKLDKYVGKQVGVYGRRGLHSASQTTYIETVELVDLEVAQRSTINNNKPLRTTFGTMK